MARFRLLAEQAAQVNTTTALAFLDVGPGFAQGAVEDNEAIATAWVALMQAIARKRKRHGKTAQAIGTLHASLVAKIAFPTWDEVQKCLFDTLIKDYGPRMTVAATRSTGYGRAVQVCPFRTIRAAS